MIRPILIGILCLIASPVLAAESLIVTIVDGKGMPVEGAVVTFSPDRYAGPAATLDDNLVISQSNLAFQPFTTLAPVGARIAFKNDDTVLHHVFSFSKPKRFDLKLFGRDDPQTVEFANAGIVTVGCNIHDGMISHIFLSDAPFAGQSDVDGRVLLENVPDGTGALMVWHPLLKQRKNRIFQTVTKAPDTQSIEIVGKFRRGLRRSSDY